MSDLVAVLFSGVAQGAVYCVIAIGLSLIYGAARVLNFAHGSLYTAGGYLAWVLTAGYVGLPLWAAIIVSIPVLFALGVALERLAIRPMRSGPNWKVNVMMITLGLAFVLDNTFLILFGPTAKVVPPFVEGTVDIGGITLSLYNIWMLVIALAIVLTLELFLGRTRHGHAIRAVAQDMQGARQVGIDVNRVYGLVFGLSVVMTGLAGILLAPIFLVSPLGGWAPFLKAFVIVVLGGLGSTKGASIAAFALAIVEAFVIYFIGASWIMPAWFVLLVIVLMVRPRGLFGTWEA